VFLTSDNRVKVLDFAIARAIRQDTNEFDASVLGGLTPAYASPEMALHLEPDPRDDVYGLACVAYELLGGRHPFNGKPAHLAQHENLSPAKIPGLSRTKMRALARGLSFTRGSRTPSVEAFLDDLGIKTVRRRRVARARPRCRRRGGRDGRGLLVLVRGAAANDAEFLAAVAASGTPIDRGADASYREPLLEQGQEYLTSAATRFDPALLSKGASSDAFHAFQSVLRIDAENPAARAGIMRIIDLYAARATELIQQGDSKGAAEVAGYGLELHRAAAAQVSRRRQARSSVAAPPPRGALRLGRAPAGALAGGVRVDSHRARAARERARLRAGGARRASTTWSIANARPAAAARCVYRGRRLPYPTPTPSARSDAARAAMLELMALDRAAASTSAGRAISASAPRRAARRSLTIGASIDVVEEHGGRRRGARGRERRRRARADRPQPAVRCRAARAASARRARGHRGRHLDTTRGRSCTATRAAALSLNLAPSRL
jgi:hypothetical protein